MNQISSYELFDIYQTKTNYRIIDVRDPHEFDQYHIKDSINIPLSLLLNKHNLFMNKNKHYYVICKSGSRSSTACQYLTNFGYNVTNVVGGIERWPGTCVRTKRY